MARPVRLLRRQPPRSTVDAWLRRRLGLVRPEDYRLVRDPWGHRVKVELWRVREYVLYHPRNHARWRLVDLIIPAIKHARRRYRKGRGVVYEAELAVRHSAGTYDRAAFVDTADLPDGQRVFSSILSPTREQDAARKRKRAGHLEATRPNPCSHGYMGPREAPVQDRAAWRVPGAAPALKPKSRPARPNPSTPRAANGTTWGRLALVVGGLWALGQLARRHQETA